METDAKVAEELIKQIQKDIKDKVAQQASCNQ